MHYIITALGCKVNQYEAQAIETLLHPHGFTAAGEGDPVDLIVVNTCAVTAEGGRKSRQMIRKLREEHPQALCAVCGCWSQLSPEDAAAIGEIVHAAGAKFVMGVNPIACAVMATPAECGADIAVGEGQPLGLDIAFGGPYLGFMAATKAMFRKLPGRIVGQTHDVEGKVGYVLTLTAREQHIRREKASSNICSNQALCALTAGVYLTAMGPEGLGKAARQSMSKAHYLAAELEKIGMTCFRGVPRPVQGGEHARGRGG